MGGTVEIGDITLNYNVSVTFTADTGTLATDGNVRTFTVGTGSILNFASQGFTNSSDTGFIKNGSGTIPCPGVAMEMDSFSTRGLRSRSTATRLAAENQTS
jgi:hypothetical protein